MQKLIIVIALISSFALAKPSCQELVDSIETAFEKADQLTMDLRISQAVFEIGYIKLNLFKNPEGIWESEIIEQRGAQQKEDKNDSAEPKIEFDCESSPNDIAIKEIDNGWRLEMLESDKTKKIRHWLLEFNLVKGIIVPTKVVADFEIKILLIPVAGQAVTNLTNWQLP